MPRQQGKPQQQNKQVHRRDDLDKPLPSDVEAEKSVLGAILMDNQALDVVEEILKPDDFFHDFNRRIYSSFLALQANSSSLELVTVTDELEKRGELESSGGAAYIAQLMDGMPRVNNVHHYAKIIKEKSKLRGLLHVTNHAQKQVFETQEPKVVVDDIEKFLQKMYDDDASDAASPVKIVDAVKESQPMFERAFNQKPGEPTMMGIPTGYAKLDEVLAGWIPGDFVILGARPSTGKTALTLEFARKQVKQGNVALYFSLEMSRQSLVMRMACMEGDVDSHKIRTGRSDKEDRQRIITSIGKMSEWPLWISEPTRMWSYDLVRRVRAFSARHPVKLVIVDYLQLLRARAENRQQEVAKVAQDLKEAARIVGKQSGGTVISTAQLSRLQPNERPRLENLRESGEMEQAADVVLFLWNADDAEPGEKMPYRKLLGVGKQRNGPLSVMRLMFQAESNRFNDPSHDEWETVGRIHAKKEEEDGGKKRRRRGRPDED